MVMRLTDKELHQVREWYRELERLDAEYVEKDDEDRGLCVRIEQHLMRPTVPDEFDETLGPEIARHQIENARLTHRIIGLESRIEQLKREVNRYYLEAMSTTLPYPPEEP